MRKSFLLQIALCVLSLHATSNAALSQVTSDGTVNTQVDRDGNVSEITGGETRGENLFHSFEDFSVPTGEEAFFDNASDIANIFSRVTGGNISNIDGLIRANDSASLFLINPAGIVFGNNARLDLGGSFYGSTADSILFESGEFSAVDLDNHPLLTVNAPIGLGFRDEPGDIVNSSRVENSSQVVGLEVSEGNLALVGRNINFESGNATARGGNIYLGALAEAGTVDLNEDGSLSTENLTLANISLSDGAKVDVKGTGGGDIAIAARNLSLAAGELGSSSIEAGIAADSVSAEAQAGDITINVTDKISISNSTIDNFVASPGTGNSGNIAIDTGSMEVVDGAQVDASTFGIGNAGAVEITATDNITVDGEAEGFPSIIASEVTPEAIGNAGGIKISARDLNITNGGQIAAVTLGLGNAGTVEITAMDDITVDGESLDGSRSVVSSFANSAAEGDAGDMRISTTNLNLTNGGQVDDSTFGAGNAGTVEVTATGDITIDGEGLDGSPSNISSFVNSAAEGDAGDVRISTTNLNLTNGGRVDASTFGAGNAGAIEITAMGDITAEGESSNGFAGIISTVQPNAEGDAGGIKISATNLNLINGGRVDATSSFGSGNAGAIEITATENITVEGESLDGLPSTITSLFFSEAEGDAGDVRISTTNLNLTNGGQVTTTTFGTGNAGAIEITATGELTIEGEASNGFRSEISSAVGISGEGDAGDVIISTNNLNLTDGGQVDATTFSTGDAGTIEITARGDITIDGESSDGFPSGVRSQVNPNAEGDAGEVKISTTNLNLTDGGRVTASTFANGNASDITINASKSINIDGSATTFDSGIFADALNEDGNGGNIFINTGDLAIANGGTIEATNFDNLRNVDRSGTGQPGNVFITANSIDLTNARIEAATQFDGGQSGTINLQVAEDIVLDDSSFISAQAFEDANGGNLDIDARFIIAFPSNGAGNDLVATAERGRGGNITLDTEQLFGLRQGRAINRGNNNFLLNSTNNIDVSGNVDGNLNIETANVNPLQGTSELPDNIVETAQTSVRACRSSNGTANNSLVVNGKGGIPQAPDLPLSSSIIPSDSQSDRITTIPQPIKTSQGKIQPARGIKVTKSGTIVLTAYHTNNAGERLAQDNLNCG